VPVPKPTCSGGELKTSMRHAGNSGRLSLLDCSSTIAQARPARAPSTENRSAGEIRKRRPGSSIMTPTPPNWRSAGRPNESMPKCNRLGAVISTTGAVINRRNGEAGLSREALGDETLQERERPMLGRATSLCNQDAQPLELWQDLGSWQD